MNTDPNAILQHQKETIERNDKLRPKLHKALWMAARGCVADRFKDDKSEVEYLRDSTVADFFNGRDYTDCSPDELIVVIEHLNQIAAKKPSARATISQLRLLRYYQFMFAIHYADWSNAMFKLDGKTLSADELRNHIYERIEKKERIDPSVYRWLFESCINPKSHAFLLEGELKQMVRNKRNLHYEYLTPPEANYLIQRFGQIYMQLSKSGSFNHTEHIGRMN